MAAKIGILGESTAVTHSTVVTLYTVPADKSARVRVKYQSEVPGAAQYAINIGSPGTEITINNFSGASPNDMWSGQAPATNPDPVRSTNSPKGQHAQDIGAMASTDGQDLRYMIEASDDYFLSTGDTVKFIMDGGADLLDNLIQVIGVEDDA